MAHDLQVLLLGRALQPAARSSLIEWMRGCTTGYQQIRAGTPQGWVVADKTGSGNHDENNDVAVVTPPGRAPIVLTVYTDVRVDERDATSTSGPAMNGPATIAAATGIALAALA